MKPICIVFDLDDTLYLERDYAWSGFCALAPWAKATLGLSDFHLKAWALFQQGLRGHIFDQVLSAAGIPPDHNTIRAMVDLYHNHVPVIHLAPDAEDCLRILRGEVHLALVSDGLEQTQRNKIKALGLEQSFESVVLTSALGCGYGKPQVKAFLTVQDHFGGNVLQFFYVGDNPQKDFLGPRCLGWKTIRVRRPLGLWQALEASEQEAADWETPELTTFANAICERQGNLQA